MLYSAGIIMIDVYEESSLNKIVVNMYCGGLLLKQLGKCAN